eukprot:1159279-Pelagomonas_calceolata.AAC.12
MVAKQNIQRMSKPPPAEQKVQAGMHSATEDATEKCLEIYAAAASILVVLGIAGGHNHDSSKLRWSNKRTWQIRAKMGWAEAHSALTLYGPSTSNSMLIWLLVSYVCTGFGTTISKMKGSDASVLQTRAVSTQQTWQYSTCHVCLAACTTFLSTDGMVRHSLIGVRTFFTGSTSVWYWSLVLWSTNMTFSMMQG